MPTSPAAAIALLATCLGQGPPAPPHESNATLAHVLETGLEVPGARVALPPPTFQDGQDEAARRAALLEVAGSERALSELLRDSVTAPFVLRTRDEEAEGSTIRVVDLWFVVRGDLDAIDPAALAEQSAGRAVEAGNMRFESRLLGPPEAAGWRAGLSGRLLGRIAVEATERVEVSRSADSLVVASRADPGAAESNRWWPVGPGGAKGQEQPYPGGVSYTRISRLAGHEGALVVEVHAAFDEPDGWFKGAPILRSKFAPIAQDQVRRLRRELAAEKKKQEAR